MKNNDKRKRLEEGRSYFCLSPEYIKEAWSFDKEKRYYYNMNEYDSNMRLPVIHENSLEILEGLEVNILTVKSYLKTVTRVDYYSIYESNVKFNVFPEDIFIEIGKNSPLAKVGKIVKEFCSNRCLISEEECDLTCPLVKLKLNKRNETV